MVNFNNLVSALRKKKRIAERSKFFLSKKKKFAPYSIGKYSYGNPDVIDWHDGAILKIGNFCSIAAGTVFLLGGNHHLEWVSTFPFCRK